MNNEYEKLATKDDKCHKCFKGSPEFGTYENKTRMISPQNKIVYIDNCMLYEIAMLWKKGIETTSCCCGHGVVDGYICVTVDYIKDMENLNYEHCLEKPDRKDLFYPHTKRIKL